MAYSVDQNQVSFSDGTVTRDPNRPGGDNNVTTTKTTTTTPTTKPGTSFSSFLDSFSKFNAAQNYKKNLSLMDKYGIDIQPDTYGLDSLAVKDQFMSNQPKFGSFLTGNPLANALGSTYNTLGSMQTFGTPMIAKSIFDIGAGKPVGSATLSGYTTPEGFDPTGMYNEDKKSLGSSFKGFLNKMLGTDFDEDAGRYLDRTKMLEAGAKLNSITGLTDSFIEEGLQKGYFENPEQAYNAYVNKKIQESETAFNTKGKEPIPVATVDPILSKLTGEQLMAYQEYVQQGYPPEIAEYLVMNA